MIKLKKTTHAKRYLISAAAGLTQLCVVATSVAMGAESSDNIAQDSLTECVILLHGLARTSSSMNSMEASLASAGYVVANMDYPSRTQSIQQLATPTVKRALEKCNQAQSSKTHVVTHSMGGILFRQYVLENGAVEFGRTVMLAPPNSGSEAVDALREVPGFDWLNGPAGLQLGTGAKSVPLQLGIAKSDIAIIAGTSSINLVLSSYLPNPDDGKVSVESTKLEGMCAHLQVPISHPFIMKDSSVIDEVKSYLKTGLFLSATAEYPECEYRTAQ